MRRSLVNYKTSTLCTLPYFNRLPFKPTGNFGLVDTKLAADSQYIIGPVIRQLFRARLSNGIYNVRVARYATMTVESKSPANKRFTTYEGKQYEVIKEGLAEILKRQTSPEANGTKAQAQTVFYNPIQQFNRDLSLLAVRAFAEDFSVIRQSKQRQQQRVKRGARKSKKRKRGCEEADSEAGPARVRPIEDVAEPTKPHAGGEGSPILSDQNAETSDKNHGRQENGSPTEEMTKTNGLDGIPTAPKADRDKSNGQDTGQVDLRRSHHLGY